MNKKFNYQRYHNNLSHLFKSYNAAHMDHKSTFLMSVKARKRADMSGHVLLVLQTDLQTLCGVRLHDSPHVQDQLTHVFPNLTPVKHKGVRDRSIRLFGHMVGCCSGFLLVLALKDRRPHAIYHHYTVALLLYSAR